MTLLKYNLISKDGKVYKPNGRKELSLTEIKAILVEKGENNNLAEIALSLIEEAEKYIEESFDSFQEQKETILKESIYYKRIKTIFVNDEIRAYLVTENGWKFLSLAKELTAELLVKEFMVSFSDELKELRTKMNNSYPQSKTPKFFKHLEIAEMFMEEMSPSDDRKVLKDMKKPPYPILLSGDLRPAISYFKYIKNDLPKLNPYMEDFFRRMHNADYFCGYLYCAFLGITIQNILYLHGEGKNGKSSFTKVLAVKTNSTAVFTEDKHELAGLDGKAFILIAENTAKHMLQEPLIKKITGQDLLIFNEKFKKPYNGRASGVIIVDSNKTPYVIGEMNETRRLRPFEMQPIDKNTPTVDAEDFEEAMGENFNDVVNHCRLCYEKLKDPNSRLIKDPPDLEELLSNLHDPEAIAAYTKFIFELGRSGASLELNETLSMKETEFDLVVLNKCRQLHGVFETRYFADNFKKYLKLHKNITIKKGLIYGIGEWSTAKESKIIKEYQTPESISNLMKKKLDKPI